MESSQVTILRWRTINGTRLTGPTVVDGVGSGVKELGLILNREEEEFVFLIIPYDSVSFLVVDSRALVVRQ